MNQSIEIRKSILYSSLKELLMKRMPAICERIEKSVLEKGYNDVIEDIKYYLEKHFWGQDTQWRIDAEVDSYPCDESGRPFGIGGFVFLEEVAKRKVLFFKTQMYNSFDKAIIKQNTIKIHYDDANNIEVVEPIVLQTSEFLDQFYNKFMAGVGDFVYEWRQLKMEWDKD